MTTGAPAEEVVQALEVLGCEIVKGPSVVRGVTSYGLACRSAAGREDLVEDEPIDLALSRDEALILFEWLARTSESDSLSGIADDIEQQVLWNVEALLERVLVEPLDANYGAILEAARRRLQESFGLTD
ncbi:hypothetical protein [Nocardioides sp.]|uniref:hypothetical protein n=1 Tax=Nocardioides sp. TaxID=35761 RepID=UPI0039E365CE